MDPFEFVHGEARQKKKEKKPWPFSPLLMLLATSLFCLDSVFRF